MYIHVTASTLKLNAKVILWYNNLYHILFTPILPIQTWYVQSTNIITIKPKASDQSVYNHTYIRFLNKKLNASILIPYSGLFRIVWFLRAIRRSRIISKTVPFLYVVLVHVAGLFHRPLQIVRSIVDALTSAVSDDSWNPVVDQISGILFDRCTLWLRVYVYIWIIVRHVNCATSAGCAEWCGCRRWKINKQYFTLLAPH